LAQDEWWYVLEGEYVFQIGEKRLQAKVGDSVFGPKVFRTLHVKLARRESL
jgi:mannose-6-phosphate isomerase-like protein (cupin superfamily)